MSVTKADLITSVHEELGVSHAECKELVEKFFDTLVDALSRGDEVKLSGFGNFILRDKNARPGRNISTGEEVTVSARRVVIFQSGRKLKSRVA